MTIKEFAKRTGMSEYTIRYYESKELIKVQRDEQNHRIYDESDIAWMLFIKRLKDTGMLLTDIKTYALLRYQGDNTMKERHQMLLQHRTYVLEQQQKWTEYLDHLDQKIKYYEEHI